MIVRHALTGIASSAFSGLSNIIIQLFAAAVLGVDEFANFAIAASTMLLCLGLTRALVGQVDLVRSQRSDGDSALGAAVVISVSFVMLGGLLLFVAPAITVVLFIAIGMLGGAALALQDSLRFRFFAIGNPAMALWSDLVVLACSIVGLVVLSFSAATALLASVVWGGATLLGVLVAFWKLPSRVVSLSNGLRWLVANRDIGFPSLGEFILQTGLPYVLNFLFLGIGGAAALSGYRLCQLIFSAAGNVTAGLNGVLTPKVVASNSTIFARHVLFAESTCAALVMLFVLGTLLLIPASLGVGLFGETWTSMLPFVVICAVHGAANALSTPCFSLLRVLGRAAFSFWVRLGSSIVTVIGVVFVIGMSDPVLLGWVVAIPAVMAWSFRFVVSVWGVRLPGRIVV